jgi:predicted nucleic acid-binding protein
VNLIKKAQFDEQSVQQLIESFYNKYNVTGIDKGVMVKASELRRNLQFSF